MVSFLGRLRYYLNESLLVQIYQSIILPNFDYADIVWNSASKSNLEQLQKLQNRAGRIILKVNPQNRISNVYIHDTLKWEILKV